MNTKHTPGPWRENSQGDSEYIFSEVYGAIAIIPHGGIHRDEHKANAKLIAAAPDLLKAAISCRDIADKCNHAMLPGHIQELLKHIETTLTEAINKATNQ